MPALQPDYLVLTDAQKSVKAREGETKIGQAIRCLGPYEDYVMKLEEHRENGARVALVGVPESIGPRGNHGRGGAELGWDAFLTQFLNLQSTPALPVHELLLVGEVDCSDLSKEAEGLSADVPHELNRLRELCTTIDQRAMQVLKPLFDAGYEVVLIGGGHNNAYPLLTALKESSGIACGAVNLDPHADFRPREGRHSGNPFSYAYVEGALEYYHVMSLHEGKNSAVSLRQFNEAGFRYHSIHRLYDMQFVEAMDDVVAKAASWQVPLGIELDVDAVQQAPASALTYTGVTIQQAFRYVSDLAELQDVRYLHLAEAAPACHPGGKEEGYRAAGQMLSELTLAYLFARQRRASEHQR